MSAAKRARARAHAAVAAAVARGDLVRPDECSACGARGPVEFHHPSYALPLDVVALCRPCHRGEHPYTNGLSLGERLRGFRTALGLTIRTVSRRSGVSKATLARIERGTSPRVDDFISICHAMGLTHEQVRQVAIAASRHHARQREDAAA